MALLYLQVMCVQLNIIQPSASPDYCLDGKLLFSALTQLNFRCDARRKMLRNAEVFDYIGVG